MTSSLSTLQMIPVRSILKSRKKSFDPLKMSKIALPVDPSSSKITLSVFHSPPHSLARPPISKFRFRLSTVLLDFVFVATRTDFSSSIRLMEVLYKRLYDNYSTLKGKRISQLDQVNNDLEKNFQDYLTAADAYIDQLTGENEKLRANINDLRNEVVSLRSEKDQKYEDSQKLHLKLYFVSRKLHLTVMPLFLDAELLERAIAQFGKNMHIFMHTISNHYDAS